MVHIFFFFVPWRYSPNLGLGLPPWNSSFHFGLLDLRHSVGLLVWVNSSSQGLYMYTNTEKRTYTDEHWTSMPEWDSNSRSWLPSERRQCMPYTARLPWPAVVQLSNCKPFRPKRWLKVYWNEERSVWWGFFTCLFMSVVDIYFTLY
jgi:hypothetical protein